MAIQILVLFLVAQAALASAPWSLDKFVQPASLATRGVYEFCQGFLSENLREENLRRMEGTALLALRENRQHQEGFAALKSQAHLDDPIPNFLGPWRGLLRVVSHSGR